jgi:hypothetical protein
MKRRIPWILSLAAVLVTMVFASPAPAQPAPPPPPPTSDVPPMQPSGYPYHPPGNRRIGIKTFDDYWVRKGVMGSLGLGFGYIGTQCDLDVCDEKWFEGVSAYFSVGAMLNPKLGLEWDWSTVGAPENNVWMSHHTSVAALRLFLTPKLYIKGGIGFAWWRVLYDDRFVYERITSSFEFGSLVSVGIELKSTAFFAVDLNYRASAGWFGEELIGNPIMNHSVNVGVTWY